MLSLILVGGLGTVRGYVYGDGNEPLGGATVVAISVPDSQKRGGTYADEKGYFELKLEPGNYLLRISVIGYERRTVPVSVRSGEIADLGRVILKSKPLRTKPLEVEAEAPKITYEGEKKVIRFGDELATKGSSTLDALRNVPGITVDNNDNVKIRNTSNITLLINGKPTVMQVSEALRQIPASSVERIEIITNPGAKYEAEGQVIMNIVLKKHHDEGMAASVMGRAGTFRNYGLNASIGINARRIKFVLAGNYFLFSRYLNTEMHTETPDFSYTTSGTRHFSMNPYGVRSSLEYHLTENDIFNLEGAFGMWGFAMGWNGEYGSKEVETDVDIKGRRLSAFAGYTKHLFINHTLEASLYYGQREGNENTINYVRDGGGNVVSGFKRLSSGPSDRLRAKLDYTWQYSKDRKLEAGYQGDLWSSYDTTEYYTYSSGNFAKEGPTLSSRLKRTTHAGYVSYSDRIGRLSYSLGVRVEDTYREMLVGDTAYTFKATDPFPSLHVSYHIGVADQVALSYSRRVWHPRHWQLNPFIRVIDEFTNQRGNPDLKPEYTHSLEASYQRIFGRKGYAGVEAFYRRTESNIDYLPSYEGGKVVYTWLNAGYTVSSGLELYATYYPWKLLTLNFSLDVYDHRVHVDSTTRSLTYDLKGSITLGRGPIGLQLTGNYNGPRYVPGGLQEASYTFDIGLRVPLSRSIFVVGQFEDVFHTFTRRTVITSGGAKYEATFRFKWPQISLMVMYDYNNFRKFRKVMKREEPVEEEAPQF